MPKPNKKSSKYKQAMRAAKAVERAGRSADPYMPTQWLPQNAGAIVDLLVPSGQLCQVKTVGVAGLIKAGILNHVDSLTALVSDKYIVPDDEDRDAIDVAALADDDVSIKNIYDVMNKVVIHTVLKPKIEPVPKANAEGKLVPEDDPDGQPVGPDSPLRQDGHIYIDTVPEEDQAFIFQYVTGGTSDLERFREQAAQLLVGVDDVETTELPSESAVPSA